MTWALITLLALVVLVPFVFAAFKEFDKELFDRVFDWAKTALPVLSGFIAAAVGYYFGAQNRTPPAKNDAG